MDINYNDDINTNITNNSNDNINNSTIMRMVKSVMITVFLMQITILFKRSNNDMNVNNDSSNISIN